MIDSIDNAAVVDLKRSRQRKRTSVDLSKADRLPPHSSEAEQGVLGCLLLDASTGAPVCMEAMGGEGAWFYDLRHQVIYTTVIKLADSLHAVDLITLQQTLKDGGQLEAVGGVAYLSQLMDAVPSAGNLAYYLAIVREKHLLREMLKVATGVIGRIYETEDEVDAFLDEVEAEVLRVAEERSAALTSPDMRTLVAEGIDIIERFHARQGELLGLPSGLLDVDHMSQGFQGGDMIVIAARPSVGKTSFALGIADFVACEGGIPVGFFSLEMTARQLVLRMLCSRARVNIRDVTGGQLAQRDFPKLTSAAGKLARAPLHIEDRAGLTILQLRAKARRMVQRHGVKLFVVDYLQLLKSTNKRAQSREQEVADISSGLKALAKELNVPVIVLAQLNRESEREKRAPRLSDLRESGAIEQDADLVALLFRENMDPEAAFDPAGETVVLRIAKQRNGPTGDIRLTFIKNYTRFENAARVKEEDVP